MSQPGATATMTRELRTGMAAFGHDGSELGIVTDVSDARTFVVNDHGARFVLDRGHIAVVAASFVLLRATGAELRNNLGGRL